MQYRVYNIVKYSISQSTGYDYSSFEPGVTQATFYFEKTGYNAGATELWIGNKVGFKLAIHFPAGTLDMLVRRQFQLPISLFSLQVVYMY